MTTSAEPLSCIARTDSARYSVAGVFLDALAGRDFGKLATALTDNAAMQALVPRGLLEFDGVAAVCGAFGGWFGDASEFHVLQAVLGEVADRLHLTWRVRLRSPSRGEGWWIVEQQVYAEPDGTGRIARLRLLCSGFRPDLEP